MKKKYIDYRKYHCKNGAFHSDLCCKTCFNNIKKSQDGNDYRVEYADLIEESRQYYFILEARKAGFTKKQAVFMLDRL